MALFERMRFAWNAFRSNEVPETIDYTPGVTSFTSSSPSSPVLRYSSERSIISSIYTRISIDAAGIVLHHVQLDEQGRYKEDLKTQLNYCLTLEPNMDQGPRAIRQDLVMTMLDKGVAVLVPVETSLDPTTNETIDIFQLRVGEVVRWYPRKVRVSVYNQDKGKREEVTLDKRFVSIVENPLYPVMNQPNSTLQRLIRKLGLLDVVDDQSSSGKLDIIIQLPYVVKSEARKAQAQKRREDIEFQLKGSQYGVAYTDATEKITQLNRPTENQLLKQVEYLHALLYSQLGLTEDVMNGTADEKSMVNYFNRTIEPIVDAIAEAMQRAFVGYKGTVEGKKILYLREPFKLVPVGQIAEIADKFARNEILSSNEIRGLIGFRPSPEPNADKLLNSNMPQPPTQPEA